MKYKVWVYGTPFSGKSYFADTFPKAFVINTDGNYQFYKNSDGKVVGSYAEFISTLQSFDPKKYDTLIIDVVDHIYDLCREEFLINNDIEHESDFTSDGAWGKGWTLLREQFWYMISKVRNIDANVVLISHDSETEVKGKLGTVKTVYKPATIPPKILAKMCGIFHFVGRCYREDDKHYINFENDTTMPNNGYRIPIKEFIIDNNYEALIKNIKEN